MSSGGHNTTVDRGDPVYNARMANIAEKESGWAQEYQEFWRQFAKPMETMQIWANKEIIPEQTFLETAKLKAERNLLPTQSAFEKAKIESATRLLPKTEANFNVAMGGAKSLMDQANQVNVHDWMGTSQADAAQGFVGVESQLKNDLARRGITPGSPAYNTQMNKLRFEKAKQVGGARTMGRRAAGVERFKRTGAATTAATSLLMR